MGEDQLDLFDPSSTPEATTSAHAEYAQLRAALAKRVLGREELLDVLAITALVHRRMLAPQRILLTGPSGSGKTHLARALAEVTESLIYVYDVQQLTETGFRGANLEHLMAALYRAARADVRRVATAVLVLDELDKLRVGRETIGNAADKRSGVQANLLPLLGTGTPVSFDSGFGEGPDAQIATDAMLIVCTGAFSGADWEGRAPTTQDLVSWGLLPELAERLTERLAIPEPSADELVDLYRYGTIGGLAGQVALFEELGYTLEVPEATYRYVARWVASEHSGLGPRSGAGLLVAAAKRFLADLLRRGIPSGTTVVLTPDDIPGVQGSRR